MYFTIRRHHTTTGAALANALIAADPGYAGACCLRFLTGASLAAVYPPSLKLLSTWFRYGRGLALGVAIGGLAVGSALPHLINGTGGVGPQWRILLLATSAMAALGAIMIACCVRTGPYAFSKAVFSIRAVGRALRNPAVALAITGYAGHMLELYGLWTWFRPLYADYMARNHLSNPGNSGAQSSIMQYVS